MDYFSKFYAKSDNHFTLVLYTHTCAHVRETPKVWGNCTEIKLMGKIYCPVSLVPSPLVNQKVSPLIYFSNEYMGLFSSVTEFMKHRMHLKYRANQVMSLSCPTNKIKSNSLAWHWRHSKSAFPNHRYPSDIASHF